MKSFARSRGLGAVALLLGLWLVVVGVGDGAQGGKEQLLPDAEYPKMVKRNVKAIQDAFRGEQSAEMVEKAKTCAVLIAAYAQQNLQGPDGQKRATVRDAALKVADLIKAKKFAEAAKLADTLATLEADPKAKKEKIKLIDDHVAYYELMHQFRHLKDGGWGIFGHLQRIQTKFYKEMPREELNEGFVLEMYQVAVSADLVNGHVHKARPKEWEEYTGKLRKSSLELAEALKARDAKSSPLILSELTTTCFNCHKLLKVKNTGN